MAFLATINFCRPPLPDAPLRCYVRVARVTATASITTATVEILSADKQKFLETRRVTFPSTAVPGGVHHIEQAYEHIKGFADFQEVEDC
jgi:hypothetical protein